MHTSRRLFRCGAASALLAALSLFIGPLPGACALATPSLGASLDACGALAVEPGLPAAWAGGKAVRPGQTVLPTDKGLGCRFTLSGKPGSPSVLVEVRLTRPSAGSEPAPVDRWYVPASPGEPAVAAYAFYPPGKVSPGPWKLELYADKTCLAATTFTVLPGQTDPGPGGASELREPVLPPLATPVGPAATPPSAKTSAPAGPGESDKVTAPAPVPSAPVPPLNAHTPQKRLPPARIPPGASSATPPRVSQSPEVAHGAYSLQAGLFTAKANAANQAVRLRVRGLSVCIAEEGVGARKRYRVLAGRFGDTQAARGAQDKVRAVIGVSPLVFRLDDTMAAKLRCR